MAINCGWPAIVVTAGTEFHCSSKSDSDVQSRTERIKIFLMAVDS